MSMEVISRGLPAGVCLNVNIPKLAPSDLKGLKICRQSAGYWTDSFDERNAPSGEVYYWLKGEFTNPDKGEDTDEWALSQGYASIVPTQFDLTAHHAIADLNRWDLND